MFFLIFHIISSSFHLKDELRETSSQASKHDGAASKDLESDQDLVDQALEHRMDDSHSNVSPCGVNGVLVAFADHGERQGDGVEDGRLLVQVVVVVGDLGNADRDLLVDVLLDLIWLQRAVVLGQSLDAGNVHPRLHHKGPACQCSDWAEEWSAAELESHREL